jgi:hypothetical protein
MNMSKRKEEDEYGAEATAKNSGLPDGTPQGKRAAADDEAPAFLAIEDHARSRRMPAPVFAAVRQMKGWSEGKKVTDAEFDEAANAFLNAPAGASAPIGGKNNAARC